MNYVPLVRRATRTYLHYSRSSGGIMNDSFADYLDTLDRLLTVNEVSQLIGTHPDTLYRWVRAKEIPVVNIGWPTKPLLRFVPRDLAKWAREGPHFLHGPARHICDWIEDQIRDGGPRLRPPLLLKVFELTGYNWLEAAQHVRIEPSLSSYSSHLMSDFWEAVRKLSVDEQMQLLSDIRSGKSDGLFSPEEAE
jgi:excisionase family DNA binding protein